MKQIYWSILLAVSVSVSNLQAEMKVIDGMRYIEKNGLRFYADVAKKNSIEIADKPRSNLPGEWWTVRAYIQNVGGTSVEILLGCEGNLIVGFPDNVSATVSYRFLSDRTVDDIAVKPPIGDFRPVVLEPGEIAQLPIANVQVKERGKLKKMTIAYAVDPDFAKWFKVWAGEVELVLDKDHP